MRKRAAGAGGLEGPLRRAIEESGLSLNELGKQAGVSRAVLSRFMRGERTIGLPIAEKVCQVLGLELVQTRSPAKGKGD